MTDKDPGFNEAVDLIEILDRLRDFDAEATFSLLKESIEERFDAIEVTLRDQRGPTCELDEGWCYTHNAWIDEHEWKSDEAVRSHENVVGWLPITSDLIDPKMHWTEAQIDASSVEARRLLGRSILANQEKS